MPDFTAGRLIINFTDEWPHNGLDWAASIGFGLILGAALCFLMWLVVR